MLIEEIRAVTSTRKDLRNFGLVVGTGFLIIGGLLAWRAKAAAPYFLGAGAILFATGLIYPPVLKPLQKAWMSLAVVMGWVMTRFILSVLFFLVLTPIGLAAKVAGKRFMDHSPSEGGDSYWQEHAAAEEPRTHLERQF